MPFNCLILCCPLLFLPSIFPSIRIFSNESVLCIRCPKYWSFTFSISQSLPSGSFHKPLIHQRADRMKTTVTENWSHRPQPCLTQWNYEPCHVGPPKTDGSWWRALTKHGPLEKGRANHFSIFALRIPWTVWKGKKKDSERWTSQVSKCPKCYWRRVKK